MSSEPRLPTRSRETFFKILTIPLWIAALAPFLLVIGGIAFEWIRPGPASHPFFREQQAKEEFADQLNQDDRVPTQKNISGLWTSGPNLTGYTVQFDLTGKSVVGRGFHWGCMGIYEKFEVAGTYDGSILSFVSDEHPELTRSFKRSEVAGFPRFREVVADGKYAEELRTMQELKQDLKRRRASVEDR